MSAGQYFLSYPEGKQTNKKQFTLETEGAMVTRQLQTWINCIVSSMVTLFLATAPQLVSSN